MKQFFSILLLSILLVAPLQAGPDAIVVRSAALHAEASHAAKRVGQLTAGTEVSIDTRQGGWKKITTRKQGVSGWVRSYQVRETTSTSAVAVESEADSRGFLAGLASFSRKASSFFKSDENSTNSGTATIGVRGLSEVEIKTAQADFAEFEKMQLFASSKKRAADFAKKGSLSAIKVPHISGKKQ